MSKTETEEEPETKIPDSLQDAIDEEPERFLDYLDIDKIAEADDPYYEFSKQFQKAFGTDQGLNLWKYADYDLLNQLFKHDLIQERLSANFEGPLDKESVKEYIEDYEEQAAEKQTKRDIRIKKPLKVKSYIREGKEVSGYSRTKRHQYSQRQERFIKSREDLPSKVLADEFNRAFSTRLTSYSIRDKRLRILGRK